MAAVAPATPTIAEFLQNSCGIANGACRNHIIGAGYDDWDTLASVRDEYAHQVCQTVRKYRVAAANAAQVRISQVQEDRMAAGTVWAKYSYLTQRPINWDFG